MSKLTPILKNLIVGSRRVASAPVTRPRLRGAVEYARQQVGIRPSPSTTPGRIVCRFRARAADADRFYEWSYPDESGIFWAPSSGYSGRSLWYQLGVSIPGAAHTIFEEWEEVPLTKR